MTEQDYIDVSDKEILCNAIQILNQVCIENSRFTTTKEWDEVKFKLREFRQKAFDNIPELEED